MENFDNVRAHVDAWLAAAGSSLAKAKVSRVKGWPVRPTFVCPECEQIIHGRWVSALPPAKWSVIAEASLASAEARDVLHRQPPSQPTHSRETPTPARLPAQVDEADWRFIGPRRKPHLPYWMTEARDAGEIAQRLAAKEAHAARTPKTGPASTPSLADYFTSPTGTEPRSKPTVSSARTKPPSARPPARRRTR